MKNLLSTCLLALITTWSMANTPITASNDPETENMSIYEAINKAGYQRMLTQRIAKSYLAIMCEIDVNKYKEHLKTSAKLFESNLKALKDYSPTEEIRNQNRYTEILWTNYKFIYSDEYTADNANIILEFNDKILKACHQTVVLLEAYAKEQAANTDQEIAVPNSNFAEVINMSGRQRMLSQRMMLYLLANSCEFGNKAANQNNMEVAKEEFKEATKKLMSNSNNSSQIDSELFNITTVWEKAEQEISFVTTHPPRSVEGREAVMRALRHGEQILYSFDEIVFLYERAATSK